MKKSVLLLLAVLITSLGFAQVKNPVRWTFTSKKINATSYEVHLTAVLDDGWHVYSQSTPDGGPIATSIAFTKNPLVLLDETPKEVGKLEQHYESLFGVDVKQYSKKVDFVQTVKMKARVKTTLNGRIEYMTCNNHECLPPSTQKFSLQLK